MATATAPKVSAWSKMFPNDQSTVQQSLLFVKKLLAVAVSNITYVRGIFPEHAYGDRCLEDLTLKILRDDKAYPGACQLIKWLKGCFDALEKKYLRAIVIGVYVDPEDPETVLESYTFKFSYSENGAVNIFRNQKKVFSTDLLNETKRATRNLLRTIIILAHSLAPLPEDVMMTMKLLYYDEVTPFDYEPPGFVPAQLDAFKFDEETSNIKLGEVATRFHSVKLRVKTDAKQFEVIEEAAPEDQQQQQQETGQPAVIGTVTEIAGQGLDGEEDTLQANTQRSDLSRTSTERSHPHEADVNGDEMQVVPTEQPNEALSVTEAGNQAAIPGSTGQAVDTTGSRSHLAEIADENLVRCACGCNEDDGLMILCEICHCWQHGVCYKVTEDEEAPVRHICDLCADPADDNAVPTDPHLHGLTDIARQATCLWRRALMACMEYSRMVGPSLAQRLGIDLAVADGLMKRLEKEGFLKSSNIKGKRLGKAINKELLKEGICKYFNKPTATNGVVPSNLAGDDESMGEVVLNQNSKMAREINKLTAQAENLDLSGQRRNELDRMKSEQSQTERMSEPKERSAKRTKHLGGLTERMLEQEERGAKRVKVLGRQDEFELSNSQDTMSMAGGRRRKRAKASKPKRSLKA